VITNVTEDEVHRLAVALLVQQRVVHAHAMLGAHQEIGDRPTDVPATTDDKYVHPLPLAIRVRSTRVLIADASQLFRPDPCVVAASRYLEERWRGPPNGHAVAGKEPTDPAFDIGSNVTFDERVRASDLR